MKVLFQSETSRNAVFSYLNGILKSMPYFSDEGEISLLIHNIRNLYGDDPLRFYYLSLNEWEAVIGMSPDCAEELFNAFKIKRERKYPPNITIEKDSDITDLGFPLLAGSCHDRSYAFAIDSNNHLKEHFMVEPDGNHIAELKSGTPHEIHFVHNSPEAEALTGKALKKTKSKIKTKHSLLCNTNYFKPL